MRNPNEVAPQSALPVVALVLTIIGFCFIPLLPIGIILAIVSLARGSEPAYAARRTLAIISLVLGLVSVPIIGVLAGIAIPNFIRFQSRSKQVECKANLKAAYTAQRSYFAEYDRFSTSPREVGFSPEKKNRYLYRFEAQRSLEEVGIEPDPAVSTSASSALEAKVPADFNALPGMRGTCPDCSITITCIGNIDNDDHVDAWSISTVDRRSKDGTGISAGMPFQHLDDLTDDTVGEVDDDAPRSRTPTANPSHAQAEEEADGEDSNAWVSYSSDGRTTLRQRTQSGQCSVECSLANGSVVWTRLGECMARKGERRFIAADCERAVVLIPAPNRGKDWAQTKVMRVYAHGKLDYEVSGAAVIDEKYIKRSPSWLQGCFGVAGEEPRYSEDGNAVEYTMVDGKPGTVSLTAAPEDADAPKKPKRKRH